MQENANVRRRLEAMITVFEMAEHHSVVLPKSIGMLLDTTGKMMLSYVASEKKWEASQITLELAKMESRIRAAAGEPDPLAEIMELIGAAMAGNMKVEVVAAKDIHSMLDQLAKRAPKADGGAEPSTGNGATDAAPAKD